MVLYVFGFCCGHRLDFLLHPRIQTLPNDVYGRSASLSLFFIHPQLSLAPFSRLSFVRYTVRLHELTTVGYSYVRARFLGTHATANDEVAHGHVGVCSKGPQPSLRLCLATVLKMT